MPPISRRLSAELLGSLFLLAAVVGSGIMAERLAGGNGALALLGNTFATVATLGALIVALGPISGAHFNPAVTVALAIDGAIRWRDVPAYVTAQVAGAVAGVALAHAMFAEPALFAASRHARNGPAQCLSELVATFGLLTTIWGCARHRPAAAPVAVPAFIAGAYWFTASTSFANPAVTIARSMTVSFSGVRPLDVPAFVAAQFLGAMAGTYVFRWLAHDAAGHVVQPQSQED